MGGGIYDGGQNALLAREGAGRPPKVSPDQLRWIADTVRDRTPDQLKFDFGLWTLRLIERQFQMTLSLPTLGKVMRQLGFTAQRPLYRAYQQDAALVQRWHTEEYPALQARARARGALIMFADVGLPRGYDLGASRPGAGGTRHRPARLRPNAVGGWHGRATPVHASRGLGQCRGIPHLPRTTHGRRDTARLLGCRWSFDS